MSVSTTSAASALLTSATTSAAAKKLAQAANGEYTAASVADDPADALKLALVKQKDGNYAAGKPKDAPVPAAAKSASSTVDALSALTLGG